MSTGIPLAPAVKGSGFSMPMWHVWCGSAIRYEGKYLLFASRWGSRYGFPQGYMTHSQIVLAETSDLSTPFEFKSVIIDGRGGAWDGAMAHNPYVLHAQGKYWLFYIGTPDGRADTRRIGFAVSDSPYGPWERSKSALDLPPNANNPCVIEHDGGYLLYLRDGDLRVSIARAQSPQGPYSVVRSDIFGGHRVEDMFVFKKGPVYAMLAEDADGYFTGLKKGGVLFESEDALAWHMGTPAYGFDVEYDDGSRITLQRRERPMLLTCDAGQYLFTSAKSGGADALTGGRTWNMVQMLIDKI